jgi:hypothetical protein
MNFKFFTLENGRQKIRSTGAEVVDFLGLRLGSSQIPISESGGAINFGGARITNIASPVNANDVVTKSYVDAVRVAARIIGNIQLATTGNITLSGEQMIDGVMTNNSRVLVKDQTDPKENGVYLSSSGAWTRVVDLDNSPLGEIYNGVLTAAILLGSTNAGKKFIITSVGTGADGLHIIGTDDIIFSEFSSMPNIQAGNGIDISGNTISVKVYQNQGLDVDVTQGLYVKLGSALGIDLGGNIELKFNPSIFGVFSNQLDLLDGSISHSKIQDNAIIHTKIAYGAVQLVHLDPAVATNDLKGGIEFDSVSGLKRKDDETFTNPNNLSVGDIVYIQSNGSVAKAQANSLSTSSGQLGVSVYGGTANVNANIVIRPGAVIDTLNLESGSSLTPGAPVFLSATQAGKITQTAPSSAGQVYRIIGYAISSSAFIFAPQEPIEIVS